MSILSFKHVFFVSRSEYFAPLFLDSIIYKVGVPPASICVVRYGVDSGKSKNIQELEGVTYLDSESVDKSVFINAVTITYLSLSSFNSKYIRWLLELSPKIKDKAYMLLTDDEVERWLECKERYGKLIPDPKLHLSCDDVWVLNEQVNFIGLDSVFRDRLTNSLGMKDWEILNATSVFDILPAKQSDSFSNALSSVSEGKKTILLGTKPNAFKYKDVKELIKAFVIQGRQKDFKFIIMWPVTQWRKRVALELYFLYLHKVKNITIDVSILTSLSPFSYNALVSSCSHLLLQARGGGGTAREYIKLGRGKVCIAKGGYNCSLFSQELSVECVLFDSYEDLVKNIDCRIDIQGNALKINEEEQRSIRELAKLYS
ncbi:hypothetical protein [Vibrio splendidus]|uniref:hypothetical protein n=1 Tax=Vibrio splendidus TaxID=29497 RepID=UPI002468956B|nr:hypothetical protein [Vibrio splendidus]MDH5888513.1 hypothetical protein [Vibrio splendidus]